MEQNNRGHTMEITEKLKKAVGDTEHSQRPKEDGLSTLKQRADGYFDVTEPEGYSIATNSEVFVRWAGDSDFVDCRMMEDTCVVQRRDENGNIERETVVSSVDEAFQRAYSLMQSDDSGVAEGPSAGTETDLCAVEGDKKEEVGEQIRKAQKIVEGAQKESAGTLSEDSAEQV
jgi:hypothetical protein